MARPVTCACLAQRAIGKQAPHNQTNPQAPFRWPYLLGVAAKGGGVGWGDGRRPPAIRPWASVPSPSPLGVFTVGFKALPLLFSHLSRFGWFVLVLYGICWVITGMQGISVHVVPFCGACFLKLVGVGLQWGGIGLLGFFVRCCLEGGALPGLFCRLSIRRCSVAFRVGVNSHLSVARLRGGFPYFFFLVLIKTTAFGAARWEWPFVV